ncbi:hypothetical protein ABBQ38_001674 [Trebouxia sp. C0009 RCD-2024]
MFPFAMASALSPAAAFSAKVRLDSHRSTQCQRHMHRQGAAEELKRVSLARKTQVICRGGAQGEPCTQTSQSQQVQQKAPNISLLDSAIQQQWDHAENHHLGGVVIRPDSRQKVSWLCQAGHGWTASPHERMRKKWGCPRCASQLKSPKHPTFAACRHALLAEWDLKRNTAQKSFPHNTNVKSVKPISWICSKCPAGQEHSWSAPPNDRTSRFDPGCPFCAGKAACKCNSLQALFPNLATEWDYQRNNRHPTDYPACSTQPVWWFSTERGSWKQTIQSRTNVVQKSARPQRGQCRHAPPSQPQ